MNKIVLFDGVCNFCDWSVQFIIKRDPKGHYKFASLQSNIGKMIAREHHIPSDIDSFILVDNRKCYYKSTAALRVCKKLKGTWKMVYFFIIIPKPIRDFFYEVLAKNRYKWFGKKDSCMIPSPEMRNRFIQEESDL
ncbi:thiol-disulfide oxidoreductase DCC family protein [Virgibacillus necropolis]|uniref:Thiol-disulfide oxidoreductase n=1 Tax=Virgibacillus necropolis TaxID=163877 RepID=A0A221MB78_9BACI|nr:thiol-disulfide oxidoreductase DCC family protein [Virgibacillus necropolis]ASN04928.1 thiol-disulfide oxidoreductase [Virgibacillus necropolis]